MKKEYRIRSDVHKGQLMWYAQSRSSSFFGRIFGWKFVSGTVELSRSESLSKLSLILKSERETVYLDADGEPRDKDVL